MVRLYTSHQTKMTYMTKYFSLAAVVAAVALTACDTNPNTEANALAADSTSLITPTEQSLTDVATEPLMDEEMMIEDEAHGLRVGSTYGDIQKAYPGAVARVSADGSNVEVMAGEYIFFLDYEMNEPKVDVAKIPATTEVFDILMQQDGEHGMEE